MKLSRIAPTLFAFAMVAALAACGGGGGGSVTPPGGGGGGTPATTPPTNPPATNPPATSPPVGVSSQVINGSDGYVNGTDDWQTNGVTASDPHDGDTAKGGNGPTNAGTIDGLSCSIGGESMVAPTVYHVHAFVGLMVNGTQYAIPDAIGMRNPTSDEPVSNFECAYAIHTHGASGIIHVEDPAIAGNWNTGVAAPAKYNLQSLFDIWGQAISSTGIAGFSGPVSIYTGTPSGKDSKGNDLVNSYTLSTASPSSILLSHHMAVWLVVGTPPSAGLPQVSIQIAN